MLLTCWIDSETNAIEMLKTWNNTIDAAVICSIIYLVGEELPSDGNSCLCRYSIQQQNHPWLSLVLEAERVSSKGKKTLYTHPRIVLFIKQTTAVDIIKVWEDQEWTKYVTDHLMQEAIEMAIGKEINSMLRAEGNVVLSELPVSLI